MHKISTKTVLANKLSKRNTFKSNNQRKIKASKIIDLFGKINITID